MEVAGRHHPAAFETASVDWKDPDMQPGTQCKHLLSCHNGVTLQ